MYIYYIYIHILYIDVSQVGQRQGKKDERQKKKKIQRKLRALWDKWEREWRHFIFIGVSALGEKKRKEKKKTKPKEAPRSLRRREEESDAIFEGRRFRISCANSSAVFTCVSNIFLILFFNFVGSPFCSEGKFTFVVKENLRSLFMTADFLYKCSWLLWEGWNFKKQN